MTTTEVSTAATAPYWDPYDADIDRDPHPTWRRLREEAPLYYNERYDFYALSRYADILAASADWQTYSSARATVLELVDRTPIATGEGPGEAHSMMIFMDPPGHDLLRRLVSHSFTPRRVAELEGRLRQLCAQLLDPFVGGPGFDFVDDFAARVPAMMIGALLGVPDDDQDQLRVWADALMHFDDHGFAADAAESSAELHRYMGAMIDDRCAHPRDDMISDLLASSVTLDDGTTRRLTRDDVLQYFNLLQVAGSETTARLLGWAAVLLARHPDQRTALVDDPSLVPNAVEELLRYEAPSPVQARFVTRDVEWHGVPLPRNSVVILITGSAGRDQRQYPDPDRFDVRRRFERHVSFGYGVHFCLGASLARLEGRIVLDETLRRLPRWDVDESDVGFVRTSTVRGPNRVPIRL